MDQIKRLTSSSPWAKEKVNTASYFPGVPVGSPDERTSDLPLSPPSRVAPPPSLLPSPFPSLDRLDRWLRWSRDDEPRSVQGLLFPGLTETRVRRIRGNEAPFDSMTGVMKYGVGGLLCVVYRKVPRRALSQISRRARRKMGEEGRDLA